MAISDVTASTLREMFDYKPDTGEFVWRIQRGKMTPGKVAGSLGPRGYWYIKVKGKPCLAHRLAFLWMTGKWPAYEVDHINGVITDNRWANLRDVPRLINMQNMRKARRDNKTGLLGVRPHQGRWRSRLRVHGKEVDLGCYDTPEQAHEAYLTAKRAYHAGCTI